MASLSEAFARALCLADDVIIHELYEAQAILQASPDYLALLSHPLLSPSRKARLLEEGFAEEAHPQTVAILKEMSRCGLCAKLGEENTGKTLVAVTALEQVGLIAAAEKGGAKVWELVPTAGKKNLADAPILKCLEGM